MAFSKSIPFSLHKSSIVAPDKSIFLASTSCNIEFFSFKLLALASAINANVRSVSTISHPSRIALSRLACCIEVCFITALAREIPSKSA